MSYIIVYLKKLFTFCDIFHQVLSSSAPILLHFTKKINDLMANKNSNCI